MARVIKRFLLVFMVLPLGKMPTFAIEKPTQVCDVIIDGPLEVCPGETNTYLITNLPPNAVVNFVNVGCCGAIGTFIFDNNNTITLQIFETNPTLSLCVNYTIGAVNCTTCIDIVAIDENAGDFTLSGPSPVCAGTEAVYFINPFPSPGADLTFTATNGTITAQNGNQVTVLWDGTGDTGELCLTYDNPCGDDQIFCLEIDIIQAPDEAVLSGLPDFACIGDPFTASISPTDFFSISWTVTNGTFTTSTDGPEVEGIFSQAGTAEICVTLGVGCNNDAVLCKTVMVSPPPNPTIAFTELCGLEGFLTAFDTRTGSTFLWKQISGPGNIFFGDDTFFAAGFIADEPGEYIISLTETLGNCQIRKTLTISLFPPLEVSQPAFICGPDGYRISFTIEGGKPPLRVNGAEIFQPDYTSELIPYGSPFSFRAEDAGLCREDLNGIENCPCRNSAGTMRSFLLTGCDTASVSAVFDSNAVLLPGNVFRFVLHTKKNDTLGNILAISRTPLFTFLPSMKFDSIYYISRVVADSTGPDINLNDPCLQVSKGQPVVFYRTPDITIPGSVTACGNELIIEAESSQSSTSWLWQNPSSATDTVTFSDRTSASTIISSDKPGHFVVWVEADYKGCRGYDSVLVSFFSVPAIALTNIECQDSLLTYAAEITIRGGTPLFLVDQNRFTDTVFRLPDIPVDVSYSIQVRDSNGCISNLLQGVAICDCFTDAGTMANDTLRVCAEGGVAAVLNADDSKKDLNDTVTYILHDRSDGIPGFIFATNRDGQFIYSPGIPLGEVLYISRVAGTAIDGLPDYTDPCLSVAAGQPVIFYPAPLPLIAPELSVCGNSLTASIEVPQNQDFTVIPSDPSRMQITLLANNTIQFTGAATGTETVAWSTSNPGCSLTGTWTVTFYSFPSYEEPSYECLPSKDSVIVQFSIQDPAGLWINNEKTIDAYNQTLAVTDLPFDLYILTDAGCRDTVILDYDCRCFSVAGTMSTDTLSVCGTSATVTARYNNDGILTGDSSFYILHTLPGSIVGDMLATSANSSFTFPTGGLTDNVYYISFVHYNRIFPSFTNDPCAVITPGQPVIFYALPTLEADVKAKACTPEATISIFTDGWSSEWSVSQAPPGSNFISAQNDLKADLPGTYRLLIISKNNHCENSTSLDVTLFNGPEILQSVTTCFDTTFVTTLSWQGGVAPYQLNNMDISGNTFSSDRIPSGFIWEAVITDARGCSVGPLSFTKECSCPTKAGEFTTSAFVLCEGENFVIPEVINTMLLPGQVLQYEVFTLKNNQETLLETIFDKTLLYREEWLDTLLYIRAVAGLLGPDGLIQKEDPCLNLGEPLNLRWAPKPDWSTPDVITTCQSENIIIPVKNLHFSPFRLYYTVNGMSDSLDITGLTYEWMLNLPEESLPQTVLISGAKNAECRTDSTFEIRIQSALFWQASVAGEFVFQDSLPIELTLNTDLPADSITNIRWTFLESGQEFITTSGELTIQPDLTGPVHIEITDVNGCRLGLQTFVRVEETVEDFVFPNILLTGSAENGIFTVFPKDKIALVTEFTVFDRWGNKQYQVSHMPPTGFVWQGQCIGGPCPDGVYVFYLRLRDIAGRSRIYSGDITVLSR